MRTPSPFNSKYTVKISIIDLKLNYFNENIKTINEKCMISD